MRIDAKKLEAFVAAIFRAAGCSEAESRRVGLYLVRANLTGHDSHGVVRVPRYSGGFERAILVPNRDPRSSRKAMRSRSRRPGYGFGQTAGPAAVRSRESDRDPGNGVAAIVLRPFGSSRAHRRMGRAGGAVPVSCRCIRERAGQRLVAPFGGAERRFSTAPFAAAFPGRMESRWCSISPPRRWRKARCWWPRTAATPFRRESLIEPDGRLSADPSTLYGPIVGGIARDARNGAGAIRAFGEHKGSGLALLCELLAGALTGSGCCGPGPRRFCNGMLSIYMAPGCFASPGRLRGRDARLSGVRQERPAGCLGRRGAAPRRAGTAHPSAKARRGCSALRGGLGIPLRRWG